MKKGLLSLLAVALTVVGCQNYDDQFQGLTDQIQGIEAQINGLPDLTSQVNDIQSTVNALTTSLQTVSTNVTANGTAIANNATSISDLSDDVADNATAIAGNNSAISDLSGDVAAVQTQADANGVAVAGVQGSVNTLSTDVANNATALASNSTAIAANGTAIGDNADDIADVLAQSVTNSNSLGLAQSDITQLLNNLADVQTDIDAVQSSLTLVATTEDLNAVSAVIANISDDVDEILAGTTSVNQAIRMTNDQEVAYANGLILTGPTSPSAYIINSTGGLVVDYTNLSASAKATATAMLAKIISVISGPADFTSSAANQIDVPVLAYVGTDLTVTGYDIAYPLLTSIDNNVIFNSNIGAITFTNRTVGGAVTLSTASVTAIDFSGSTIAGGVNNGYLNLPAAESINIGTGTVTKVIAPVATTLVLGQTANASSGTYTNLDISATATNAIVTLGLQSSAGTLDITTHADGSGTVNATSLASAAGGITATHGTYNFTGLVTSGALDINTAAEANFTALTTFDAASDIEATTLTLPALLNVQAATDLNTSTVAITTLASVTADLTLNAPTVLNVPAAIVADGASIIGSAINDITVGSLLGGDFDEVPDAETIAIAAQSVDFAAPASTDELESLTITAAASTGANAANAANLNIDLAVSSTDSLTTVVASGFDTVLVDGTSIVSVDSTNNASLTLDSAASSLATATLSGVLVNFSSVGVSTLAELNLNNVTYFDRVGLNDQPIDFTLSGSAITSLDLSSMERVERTYIVSNTALTYVTAPSSNNLLVGGATVSITIYDNSATATYTNSTPAYLGDGIQPPADYVDASLESPWISSWNTYLTAVSAINTITLKIGYGGDDQAVAGFDVDTNLDDTQDPGTAGAADDALYTTPNANGYDGFIDTLAELQICSN